LDEYVAMLLARRDSLARVEKRLAEMHEHDRHAKYTGNFASEPLPSHRRTA
jgi:hypothetical protein